MHGNNYEGLVERWKVELMISRAKRLGFRGHDLDDVQQEIILDVMNFVYRPEGSNGATLATALTSLIDRRLKTMLRSKRRYQEHLDAAKYLCEESADGELSRIHLTQDVQDAIDRLPPRERAICVALSQGKNWATIAEELGCGWHTVERAVERIRDHFQTGSLDSWLEK